MDPPQDPEEHKLLAGSPLVLGLVAREEGTTMDLEVVRVAMLIVTLGLNLMKDPEPPLVETTPSLSVILKS